MELSWKCLPTVHEVLIKKHKNPCIVVHACNANALKRQETQILKGILSDTGQPDPCLKKKKKLGKMVKALATPDNLI